MVLLRMCSSFTACSRDVTAWSLLFFHVAFLAGIQFQIAFSSSLPGLPGSWICPLLPLSLHTLLSSTPDDPEPLLLVLVCAQVDAAAA